MPNIIRFGGTSAKKLNLSASVNDVLAGKTFSIDGKSTLTGSIPSLDAKTYTPTRDNQTIAVGQYLSGVQTIKGDANLVPANIKAGVSIFNVTGSAGGVEVLKEVAYTSLIEQRFEGSSSTVSISNSGVIGDIVYAITNSGLQKYNPITNTFTTLGTTLISAAEYAACCTTSNGVYYSGGESYTGGVTSTFKMYSPSTNTLTTLPSYIYSRQDGMSASYQDSKIYFMGGRYNSDYYKYNECYDIATNTLSIAADLPSTVANATVETLKDKIYVLGGRGSTYSPVSYIRCYNPVTNTWSTQTALKKGRNYPASVAKGNRIYVFGGMYGSYDGQEVAEAEYYDSTTNTTTILATLSTYHYGGKGYLINDEVYVLGGTDRYYEEYNYDDDGYDYEYHDGTYKAKFILPHTEYYIQTNVNGKAVKGYLRLED